MLSTGKVIFSERITQLLAAYKPFRSTPSENSTSHSVLAALRHRAPVIPKTKEALVIFHPSLAECHKLWTHHCKPRKTGEKNSFYY